MEKLSVQSTQKTLQPKELSIQTSLKKIKSLENLTGKTFSPKKYRTSVPAKQTKNSTHSNFKTKTPSLNEGNPKPMVDSIEEVRVRKKARKKLDQTFEHLKNGKFYSKEFKDLEHLGVGLESTCKVLSEAWWMQAETKLLLAKEITHLGKLFEQASKSVNLKCIQMAQELKTLQTHNHQLTQKASEVTSLKEKLSESLHNMKLLEKKNYDLNNFFKTSTFKKDLEREQLHEKVNILESNLKEVKDIVKIDSVKKELSHYKELYERTHKQLQKLQNNKEARVFRVQLKLNEAKEKLAQREETIHQLESEIKDNQFVVNNLKERSLKLEQRNNELKESYKMLTEEAMGYSLYKKKLDKTEEDLKQVKLKYNHLEMNIATGTVVLANDGIIWVPLNDELFNKARVYYPHTYKTELLSAYKDFEVQPSSEEIQIDLSSSELEKTKFNRPSYSAFFEFSESRMPLEMPFSNWLQIHIRAIYDSKHYEHKLCSLENEKLPSRFPEFVYSWFGNFYIDESTRNVKKLESQKEFAEKLRFQVLLALKDQKSKRVWEIHTFLGFLNEEFMVDELSFFLHCRFLLFGGPELAQTSCKYSAVHFVDLEKAFKVIDMATTDFTEKDRNELKSCLESKAKTAGKNAKVDSALTLRVLLEYYVREKKCRYFYIKELFRLAPKTVESDKTTLSFFAFKTVCFNINNEISEEFVLKFYRDLWILGQGEITFENFFKLANENGFFYFGLKLRTNQEPPEVVARISKTYFSLIRPVKLIRELIESLGVAQLMKKFSKLEEIIQNKEPNSSMEVYKELWVEAIKVQVAHEESWKDCLPVELTEKMQNLEFTALPSATEGFVEKLHNMTLQEISKKAAMRRIQNKWKKRAAKNLGIAQTVMKGLVRFKKGINKD